MRRAFSLAGVVVLVLALAPTAQATSGTWTITSDTTLTDSHYGSIVIAGDNITLDCASYAVVGPDQGNGIVIDGFNGVTVKNCDVRSFEEYGIWAGNGSGTRLLNNSSRWNGLSGIDVVSSTDVLVENNVTSENGFGSSYSGIDIEGSSNVFVHGNSSFGNEGNGLYTYESSWVEFVGNSAYGNGTNGIWLDWGTTSSSYSQNWSSYNGWNGYDILGSTNNEFIRNTAYGNGDAGFALTSSRQNLVRSNDINWNGVDGVRLDASDRNRVINNDLNYSGLHGVILQNGSDYNTLRYNRVLYTGSSGIPVTEDSNWNVIEENVSSFNSAEGFHIFTAHNALRSNDAFSNGGAGFRLSGAGARRNKLTKNEACNNGDIDGLQDADVGHGNVWRFNTFCTSDI